MIEEPSQSSTENTPICRPRRRRGRPRQM